MVYTIPREQKYLFYFYCLLPNVGVLRYICKIWLSKSWWMRWIVNNVFCRQWDVFDWVYFVSTIRPEKSWKCIYSSPFSISIVTAMQGLDPIIAVKVYMSQTNRPPKKKERERKKEANKQYPHKCLVHNFPMWNSWRKRSANPPTLSHSFIALYVSEIWCNVFNASFFLFFIFYCISGVVVLPNLIYSLPISWKTNAQEIQPKDLDLSTLAHQTQLAIAWNAHSKMKCSIGNLFFSKI